MNQIDQQLFEMFSDKTLSFWCTIDTWAAWIYIAKNAIGKIVEWQLTTVYLPSDSQFTILWHPPQLHDVFRVWINNGILFRIIYPWYSPNAELHIVKRTFQFNGKLIQKIAYSPELPLLSQDDSTKSAILSLFK
jgi:hypothetical protein